MAGEVRDKPRVSHADVGTQTAIPNQPQPTTNAPTATVTPDLPSRSATSLAGVPQQNNPLARGIAPGASSAPAELTELRDQVNELLELGRANPQRLADAKQDFGGRLFRAFA
jgi:hypothetical protein